MSESARISLDQHTAHPWRAHTLMPDFEVEDVWKLPMTISADEDMAEVRERLFAALASTMDGGLAGWLFDVRLKLGDVFGWDGADEDTTDEVGAEPAAAPGSLAERYAAEEGDDVGERPNDIDGAPFSPVYVLENETLDELANATAHAALHLGRVPLADSETDPTGSDGFGIQMAVYVKPNGKLGQLYMAGIKPFRHQIVYPTLMKRVAEEFA